MSDNEDLPRAKAFTRYEWDCPECPEVNDESDVNPQGEVVECAGCHARVLITEVM